MGFLFGVRKNKHVQQQVTICFNTDVIGHLLELKNKQQLIVAGINDQKLRCFALRRK
jgi:hypothetical protein